MFRIALKTLKRKYPQSRWLSRSGQALIQAMIAASILGIISMGVLTLTQPNRPQNFQTDTDSFSNFMLGVISNSAVCSAVMAGRGDNKLHFIAAGYNGAGPFGSADDSTATSNGQELTFDFSKMPGAPYGALGALNSGNQQALPDIPVQVNGFYFRVNPTQPPPMPALAPHLNAYYGDLIAIVTSTGTVWTTPGRRAVGPLLITIDSSTYAIQGCSSPLTPSQICQAQGCVWTGGVTSPCRCGMGNLNATCPTGDYITSLTPVSVAGVPSANATCASGTFMCPCDIDPATGLPLAACADNQRQVVIGIDPTMAPTTPGWPLICQPLHKFPTCTIVAGVTSWTVGAQTCISDNTITWPASVAGAPQVATDSAHNGATATYTCTLNAVTNQATMTGPTAATCSAPAPCVAAAGALSWVDPVTSLTCTNDVAVTLQPGSSQKVVDNTSGANTGYANYTCNPAGTAFDPPASVSCVTGGCVYSALSTWTDSVIVANVCTNPTTITIPKLSTVTVQDNTGALKGSVQVNCPVGGPATIVAGTNSCVATCVAGTTCTIPAGTTWADSVNSGVQCSSDSAVTIADGATGTLTDSTAPSTGTTQYTCTCGTIAKVAGSNHCASTSVTGYCVAPSQPGTQDVPFTPGPWAVTTLYDCLMSGNDAQFRNNCCDQQVNPGIFTDGDFPLCPNCTHFYPIGTTCWDGDQPYGHGVWTISGQGDVGPPGGVWSYGTAANCWRGHNHMMSNRYYSCATGEKHAYFTYYGNNGNLTGGQCWGSPPICVGARTCPEIFHTDPSLTQPAPTSCNTTVPGTPIKFGCAGDTFDIDTSICVGFSLGCIHFPQCQNLTPAAGTAACNAATAWAAFSQVSWLSASPPLKCFSQSATFTGCNAGNMTGKCTCN